MFAFWERFASLRVNVYELHVLLSFRPKIKPRYLQL